MTVLRSLTLAAALAGGAVGAPAAAERIGSESFAPGWQEHARALINHGPSPLDLSKSSWLVPGITPPGRYVLIERRGDKAQVIDGYQFQITSARNSDIHMIVPAGYGNVEALPVEDVPGVKARSGPSDSR
jgi:hypothetical protein